MMGLAPFTGRGAAHDLVYGCCRDALEQRTPLVEQLAKRPEITRHLDRGALERLCDPANYLGAAGVMVDRMVGRGA
jgi:3-carboxy-cis,cis-muconate cycloisomerase